MQQRTLRGMYFVAGSVLLGTCLVQAQNQEGIGAEFVPTVKQKLAARAVPAKATNEQEVALVGKGYVLIGSVNAWHPGTKADAEITKQLEAAILQKAAEAGGDVVHFSEEGIARTWDAPTGKTKTTKECVDSHEVTVSTGPQCIHSCYTDNHGFQHCNDIGCAPGSTSRTQCVKWETREVAIRKKEPCLLSDATVWRYDPQQYGLQQASVVIGAPDSINIAAKAGDLNRLQALLKDHPDLISNKDASGDTPLHNAVAGKDKAVVEFLVAKNADVNARDVNGATPLHIAGYSGDESMAQLLLDHKADINARNNNGETILAITALHGTPKMAEFLLANKADVNIRDKAGLTPLHGAALGGQPEMVRVLLAHKADVNAGDLHGNTPLAFIKVITKLQTKQSKEIAEILRQAGGGMVPDTSPTEIAAASAMPSQPGVSQVQSRRKAETHTAAGLPRESADGKPQSSGQPATEETAQNDKAPVTVKYEPKTNNGWFPQRGVPATITSEDEKSLESGYIKLGIVSIFHSTPGEKERLLQEATSHGGDVVLIEAADTPSQIPSGQYKQGRCIGWARKHHTDCHTITRYEPGSNNSNVGYTKCDSVDDGAGACDDWEQVPVLVPGLTTMGSVWRHDPELAAKLAPTLLPSNRKEDKEEAERLLAGGADVNAKDRDGETQLHKAVMFGEKNVAELLLAHAADVNAKDKNGETPLHYEARSGWKELAELLLAHGADVHAKDKNGETPLHYAASLGQKEVAELILAHGADVDSKGYGSTPLNEAASGGYKVVAELLLAHGADVNSKDRSGDTPLHNAAMMGRTAVVVLLMDHGADVNAKDNHGLTPLQCATSGKHDNVADLLRQHGGHE